MVTRTIRGVTLSAHAVLNGHPAPFAPSVTLAGRGDFAERQGGRIRRDDRRAAIARKRAWLEA